MSELARFSKVDSDRFGKRIHRSEVQHAGQVARLDEQASREAIDMIVARVSTRELEAVHALESAGYLLMDTLVYYAGPTGVFEHEAENPAIRPATMADQEPLRIVASDAFADFHGHYHTDPRLDRGAATLGYVDWCLSCLTAEGHAMWVATEGDDVAGFIAVHRSDGAAEIRLNGVASRFQRRGVYDGLVKVAGQSLFRQGVLEWSVSTQIDNLAPQKVWVRNRMTPTSSLYTFHKWYDR